MVPKFKGGLGDPTLKLCNPRALQGCSFVWMDPTAKWRVLWKERDAAGWSEFQTSASIFRDTRASCSGIGRGCGAQIFVRHPVFEIMSTYLPFLFVGEDWVSFLQSEPLTSPLISSSGTGPPPIPRLCNVLTRHAAYSQEASRFSLPAFSELD